jgi:transposase
MSGERKRRYWSLEEKQIIVSQSAVPGISISQIARRYDVNANMVYKWRRELGSTAYETSAEDVDAPSFLPVSVADHSADIIVQAPEPFPAVSPDGKILITVAGDMRLEINGSFDGDALAHLIKALRS